MNNLFRHSVECLFSVFKQARVISTVCRSCFGPTWWILSFPENWVKRKWTGDREHSWQRFLPNEHAQSAEWRRETRLMVPFICTKKKSHHLSVLNDRCSTTWRSSPTQTGIITPIIALWCSVLWITFCNELYGIKGTGMERHRFSCWVDQQKSRQYSSEFGLNATD